MHSPLAPAFKYTTSNKTKTLLWWNGTCRHSGGLLVTQLITHLVTHLVRRLEATAATYVANLSITHPDRHDQILISYRAAEDCLRWMYQNCFKTCGCADHCHVDSSNSRHTSVLNAWCESALQVACVQVVGAMNAAVRCNGVGAGSGGRHCHAELRCAAASMRFELC
jgi:hypothetical protein